MQARPSSEAGGPRLRRSVLAVLVLLVLPFAAPAAQSLSSVEAPVRSLSPLAAQAVDLGVAPDAFPVQVVVGLQLRDKAGLDAYLQQASDPASPLFQKWLTLDAFNAQYAPTQDQESRVAGWLRASGFSDVQTTADHLLVIARGDHAAAQRAFQVPIHLVTLGGASRYAVLEEPRFPADVASFTTGVTGLDDLTRMQPRASVGGCCSFSPNDLKTLYANTAGYDGSGQTIVLAGAYAWLDTDLATFDTQFSLPALPAGSAQVCTGAAGVVNSGCAFNAGQSIEVSLDVQYSHGTAPAAVVKNYMAASTLLTDFQVMYNRIVVDNPGHSVSSSWGSCESGTSSAFQTTADNLMAAGAAEGQSWFIASGDSGSHACGDSTVTVDTPANSPHAMGVGGTHASCSSGMTSGSPACGGYGSESAWSGSGGGRSATFAKPSWQTGCSVPADGQRDVPDVALESDTSPGNYVRNGGSWYVVGGTSDAAPQWAGYFAELNQKKGGLGLGLPGPRLYALCGTSVYHDITSGSNGYAAGTGYDLVTGLGSVNAGNLLSSY